MFAVHTMMPNSNDNKIVGTSPNEILYSLVSALNNKNQPLLRKMAFVPNAMRKNFHTLRMKYNSFSEKDFQKNWCKILSFHYRFFERCAICKSFVATCKNKSQKSGSFVLGFARLAAWPPIQDTSNDSLKALELHLHLQALQAFQRPCAA